MTTNEMIIPKKVTEKSVTYQKTYLHYTKKQKRTDEYPKRIKEL